MSVNALCPCGNVAARLAFAINRLMGTARKANNTGVVGLAKCSVLMAATMVTFRGSRVRDTVVHNRCILVIHVSIAAYHMTMFRPVPVGEESRLCLRMPTFSNGDAHGTGGRKKRMASDWKIVIDDTGFPSVCSDSEDRCILHRCGFINEYREGASLQEAMQIAQAVVEHLNKGSRFDSGSRAYLVQSIL